MKDFNDFKLNEEELDKVVGGITDAQFLGMDSYLQNLCEEGKLTDSELKKLESKLSNSKDSVVQSYLEEKAQNNESWGQIYKHYRKVMGLDESNT